MNRPHAGGRGVLIPCVLLSLTLTSCAYLRGVGGPRLFVDPATMTEEPRARSSLRYDGSLRVPLVEEWRFELPDVGVWAISRFEAGLPLVDGERVLVGSSRASGLLFLDRRTGGLLHTTPTVNPVQSRPTRVEDRILVADTGGYVYMLTTDGEVLWRFHAGGPITETPLVEGGRVYATTTTDLVLALDESTGSWLWSYRSEERLTRNELSVLGSTRPVIRDGRLYAGLSDGRLVCLDAHTGAKEWELEIAEGRFLDVDATPVFTDDGMLITGSYSGPVVAVDLERRAVAWRFESGINGDISAMYGRLFFADETGMLHCLDAADGEEQWSWMPSGPKDLLNTPVSQGRILLVAHNKGALYALDAFSGEQLWRHEPRESHLGAVRPPTIDGRQVLVVTGDGYIRSLRAPPGVYDTGEDEPARRDSRHLGW